MGRAGRPGSALELELDLSVDMSWLEPLLQYPLGMLLYTVFVDGSADTNTTVIVMSVAAALLFVLLGVPKLKQHIVKDRSEQSFRRTSRRLQHGA